MGLFSFRSFMVPQSGPVTLGGLEAGEGFDLPGAFARDRCVTVARLSQGGCGATHSLGQAPQGVVRIVCGQHKGIVFFPIPAALADSYPSRL
jgi:hypothetical protein